MTGSFRCQRYWCCGNWIDDALAVLGLATAAALAGVVVAWRRGR